MTEWLKQPACIFVLCVVVFSQGRCDCSTCVCPTREGNWSVEYGIGIMHIVIPLPLT